MKCQSLFSWKNNKKYFKMSPIEILPCMLSINNHSLVVQRTDSLTLKVVNNIVPEDILN